MLRKPGWSSDHVRDNSALEGSCKGAVSAPIPTSNAKTVWKAWLHALATVRSPSLSARAKAPGRLSWVKDVTQ